MKFQRRMASLSRVLKHVGIAEADARSQVVVGGPKCRYK